MERPIGGTRSPQITQLGRAASVPHPVGRAARCRREVGVVGRARVAGTSAVQEALVGGTRPQPGALVVAAAVPETIVLAELRVDSKGRAATRHSMGARGKANVQCHWRECGPSARLNRRIVTPRAKLATLRLNRGKTPDARFKPYSPPFPLKTPPDLESRCRASKCPPRASLLLVNACPLDLQIGRVVVASSIQAQ